jgi:RNA polymerase sigma-70 factor (ECF subfamily)
VSDALALVACAQAGDADAFGDLYRQYRDTVFSIAVRRVTDRELAEDITQEVFLRALRGIERWKWEGKDFGAWLATIAKNLTVDHYKSSRYRKSVTVGDYSDLGVDIGDTSRDSDPADVLIAKIQGRDLANALHHITQDQAECLNNRYLRQLSVTETARVMGREEGAIKALTFRALQALNRFLSGTVTA